MRFARRTPSWRARSLAAALGIGVAAVALPAQERQDSVVQSARSSRALGDQVIRVLLGYTASAPQPGREDVGTVTWNGRRYRGSLDFVGSGNQLAVINRVDLEEYLRGVLPGEIGSRDPRDRAALQAQAVAARSYAASRMGERRALYDVTATVSDQVYGGMAVERPETDDAVRATRGLVLTWGDRIINAPYSSHGGPITAAPDEVFWK
ncbi:MAG TPA: SpoIID/LytB domain-containing protein, partial [Gemmatimonadaceae bacterium]|nr:SpoIID/LytB domain-containing protein [Gemmatimonadaceae bacterium]